jgi:metal-sulfur cluster biosynthetic enzyme
MSVEPDILLASLEQVLDPCSVSMGRPMSICELGLVEQVSWSAGVVTIVLCLTDPGCINYGKIRQYVSDVLMQVPGVESVNVSLSTTQLWSPELMRATPQVQPSPPSKRGSA